MLATDSCCLLWDRLRQLLKSGEYWMGSSESGPHDIQSSEGGSACLCRLRLCRLCALQQALSCILMHTGISPPQKLNSSMVTELDDTLPCFTNDRRDSVRATHGLPGEGFMWKTALRWSSTRSQLFDSHRERWPLMWPSWLTCVMLWGYFSLARWLLIQISATSLAICEAYSLSRTWHYVMVALRIIGRCWLVVVMIGCYIIYCMSYIHMFNIHCKFIHC
jgi:hypothetical protein